MGRVTHYPADADTGELLRTTIYWRTKPSDPFTFHGSAMGQSGYGERDGVWKDNVPFTTTMTFAGTGEGMFLWRDDATGLPWSMFPTEMEAVLNSGSGLVITDGQPVKLSGTFDVTKRSTRYALRWLGV